MSKNLTAPHLPRPPSDRKGEAPTLADVAARVGVSTATVSRCLNEPTRVTEATRKRVAEVVAELGYSPNFGARALAAKRTNTIGAIIPTMENAVFAQGLQAFQEELSQNGVTMLVASSSYDPEIEEAQIRNLIARGADALLLIGYEREPAVYQFLTTRQVPILCSWIYRPDAAHPTIGFDNCAAMRELTEHVIRLGHRHIAMISAHGSVNDRAAERVIGARQALSAAGLEDQFQLIETSYSIESGAEAFETLNQGEQPPTAILCGTDVLAVGALNRARSLGLSVPRDVSVTGFADIELASVVTPALTTVHVPHRRLGKEAASMLIKMVEGWCPDEAVRLETNIVMRETLGPACK